MSRARREKDDRGVSFTAFVCGFVIALILIAGLVVDGGAQMAATRRAEAVASEAARAATDASAVSQLHGGFDTSAALAAARAYGEHAADMSLAVSIRPGGVVHVDTTGSAPTLFLSLIGIDRLTAHGSADAQLRGTR